MIKHLRLKAYGKINLALDVLGRRADGYHEVRMIMQTVGLHDRIDLYVTQEPGIKIETNLFYLPDNEQNLAHKAARLLMEEFGIRQGLSIICASSFPCRPAWPEEVRTLPLFSLESIKCLAWACPPEN